jgi:hypothetical protein
MSVYSVLAVTSLLLLACNFAPAENRGITRDCLRRFGSWKKLNEALPGGGVMCNVTKLCEMMKDYDENKHTDGKALVLAAEEMKCSFHSKMNKRFN